MDKLTYLLTAFNHRAYTKKAFLISILSIVNPSSDAALATIPYALRRDWDNDQVYFIDPVSNEKIVIENARCNEALFYKKEIIDIEPNQSNHVPQGVTTTFGRFLTNVVVIHEAFKGQVGYINERIDGKRLKAIIAERMIDTPQEGEPTPEGKSPVGHCLKVTQQLDYLVGLNPIIVKASSSDAFTIHPELIALRDELLNQLDKEGKLGDPIAVAGVIDLLVEKDVKLQYNGPSADLYISRAFVSNNRKKMFLLFDFIPNFHTGKYELLRKSLNEGWELSQYTAYVNTAIEGTYSRSVSVALAGADVKTVILLTGKMNAIKGDCGSQRTEQVVINERNFRQWVGSYYLNGQTLALIDKNDFDTLNEKRIGIRVPQYCKQPGNNLCSTCLGTRLGGSKDRVSPEVSLMLSKFFLLSMKKIHSSELKTKLMKLENILR